MHSVAPPKSKAIVLLRERVGEIFSNSYISGAPAAEGRQAEPHTHIRELKGTHELAIIEWGWVGYEEFCRSRRMLSTEAEGRGG